MSFCPVAGKCGGCQLQNMTYERQLGFKEAKVVKLLGKYCHVDKIIGMEHPYHYRNKVQAAFGSTRGGRIISGVYQSKSHRIVCIDSCKIEDRKADEIIVTIRSMIPKYRMTAYNEDRGTGFLRDVCRAVHIPVYAIGGIRLNDPEQLQEILDSGAAGGAVMSACMRM